MVLRRPRACDPTRPRAAPVRRRLAPVLAVTSTGAPHGSAPIRLGGCRGHSSCQAKPLARTSVEKLTTLVRRHWPGLARGGPAPQVVADANETRYRFERPAAEQRPVAAGARRHAAVAAAECGGNRPAQPDRRARRERGPLPRPHVARMRLVLGPGREFPLHRDQGQARRRHRRGDRGEPGPHRVGTAAGGAARKAAGTRTAGACAPTNRSAT